METKDKILIVEDDETIATFLIAVLEANGFDTIRASLGREAVTLISSHCPDLVLLDLSLPDMDGMEILAGLRKWSTLPVIVVSARGRERDKVIALDMGADDYLTKPFGPARASRAHPRRPPPRPHRSGRRGRTHGRVPLRRSGGWTACGGACASTGKISISRRANTAFSHCSPAMPERSSPMTLSCESCGGPLRAAATRSCVSMWRTSAGRSKKNPAEPKYIFTEIGVGYRMTDADAPDEPEQ